MPGGTGPGLTDLGQSARDRCGRLGKTVRHARWPRGRYAATQASHSEGRATGCCWPAISTMPRLSPACSNGPSATLRCGPTRFWRGAGCRIPSIPCRTATTRRMGTCSMLGRWCGRRQFDNRAYLTRAGISPRPWQKPVSWRCRVMGRTLLLPAQFGFKKETPCHVNPSYYMPLAMREVAAVTGVSALAICAQHGEALLDRLAQERAGAGLGGYVRRRCAPRRRPCRRTRATRRCACRCSWSGREYRAIWRCGAWRRPMRARCSPVAACPR